MSRVPLAQTQPIGRLNADVATLRREMGDLRAQNDAIIQAARYSIVADGTDQTDELNAMMALGSPVAIKPGTYKVSSRSALNLYMLDWGAREDQVVDFGGSVIEVQWDPTNDATIAATLRDVLRIRDWKRCAFRGATFDYSPKVYATGEVTAVASGSFTFRADEPFAFRSADKFERLSPDEGGTPASWQFLRDNNRASMPAPIVDHGDGTYTVQPASITATIASVYSYGGSGEPLVLYAPGNGITDRQQVRPMLTGAGALATQLNGNTYVARLGQTGDMEGDGQDEDAASDYIRLYLLDDETPVDGSAATGTFAGGTIQGLGVPSWLLVGDGVRLSCRKRSGNVGVFNRMEDCTIEAKAAQATALAFAGQNNTNLTFHDIDIRNGSAGGFLIRDTEGFIRFTGSPRWTDIGDNAFNFPATAWDASVATYADVAGKATITLTTSAAFPEGWHTGDNKGIAPRRPKRGQRVEFIDPTGALVVTRKVASVSGNSVTLDGALPAGYFPAASGASGWTIVPRDYVHRFRSAPISIDGCATAGLLLQTGDYVIEGFNGRRIRAEAARCSMPGSGRTGPVGFRDGGTWGPIVLEWVAYKLHPRTGSAMTFRRTNTAGQIATATPVDPFTQIESLTVRNCGYGVVAAFNSRVSIGRLALSNTGTRRDVSLPASVNLAKYDLYAAQGGAIRIGQTDASPTTLAETSGAVEVSALVTTPQIAGKLNADGGTATNVIVASGSIGLTVTGVTQAADNSSTRLATTRWVRDRITEVNMGSTIVDASVASLTAGQAAGTDPVLTALTARRVLTIQPPTDAMMTIASGATMGVMLAGGVPNTFEGAECPTNAIYLLGLTAGSSVLIWWG